MVITYSFDYSKCFLEIIYEKMDCYCNFISYSSPNGVALTVPSTWVSAESKSNMTLLAVADPNSKDSSGFSNVNINVEKKETINTLKNEFESNYKSLSRNSGCNGSCIFNNWRFCC